MSGLDTTPRLGSEADAVYEALVAAHDGLDPAASARLNARLVLLLANQLGDAEVVRAAIDEARDGLAP